VISTGAEAIDPQVSDVAISQDRGADIQADDGVARDRKLLGLVVALEGQDDLAAAWATDEHHGVVDGLAVQRSPADGLHDIVREQASGERRCFGQHFDDAQLTGIADGLAGGAVGSLGVHPGADALELAIDAGEGGFELVRAHVGGVRVIEGLEHAVDGARSPGSDSPTNLSLMRR